MATFHLQVEGITGLSIDGSSSPTQDELTEFLKDGVIDVTNRTILARPRESFSFLRSSSESVTQYGLSNSVGKIINVVREAGTDNDWRNCKLSSLGMQSRLTDVDSLHFVSKYNPAYVVGDDGSIGVFPVPSSGGANSYKIYYVNSSPVNSSDASLEHSHSNLNYFPEDKVYLVIIYAGMKSLENAMSAKSVPSISGDGTELTSVDDLDTDNTIDVHADQIEIDQWWSTVGHLIEDEEDPELAITQIQKITAYVQAYQAQLQGNTADYNWMQARHQLLVQQYERAFSLMSPAQQAQPQGAR